MCAQSFARALRLSIACAHVCVYGFDRILWISADVGLSLSEWYAVAESREASQPGGVNDAPQPGDVDEEQGENGVWHRLGGFKID